MNVRKILKPDEASIIRLLAWPKFFIGAGLLILFGITVFVGSLIVGYGLKLISLFPPHRSIKATHLTDHF